MEVASSTRMSLEYTFVSEEEEGKLGRRGGGGKVALVLKTEALEAGAVEAAVAARSSAVSRGSV